jgi:hypothetical protein
VTTRVRKRPKIYDHFKVICISVYNEDLAQYQRVLAEMKARGHRKSAALGGKA